MNQTNVAENTTTLLEMEKDSITNFLSGRMSLTCAKEDFFKRMPDLVKDARIKTHSIVCQCYMAVCQQKPPSALVFGTNAENNPLIASMEKDSKKYNVLDDLLYTHLTDVFTVERGKDESNINETGGKDPFSVDRTTRIVAGLIDSCCLS